MSLAARDLHRAIYRALLADDELTALIGPRKVFDRVPDRIAEPYVVIGQMSATDWTTATEGGEALVYTIHAWSGAKNRGQCLNIQTAISRILTSGSLTLSNNHLIANRRQFAEITRDRRSGHFHGVTRFRGVTEPLTTAQS